ncbi:MAG: recombinase family protein [Phenylobacterium sp.]|nr:recombinase family protein [Phenylobacterium sp.]
MRYGIIVEGPRAPSAETQRALMATLACDVVVTESAMTADARRRLGRLIGRLKQGDELAVHGLEAFGQTTGELSLMLREIFRSGAAVAILGEPGKATTLGPQATAGDLVNALAEHESGLTVARAPLRRRRGEVGGRLRLTAHQIDYVRKLHAEGTSPRAIGLLFQVTPDDVWQIVEG